MKRDWDLVIAVLKAIEASDAPVGKRTPVDIPGRSDEQINYHIKLLSQAGLIAAIPPKAVKDNTYIPMGLTWDGHDFLDNTQVPGVWETVKKTIIPKGGSLAFDVLRRLLVDLALQTLTRQ